MKVLKFGGSSVADAEKIERVIDIINSSENNRYVVFSAMKGITNLLIDSALKAEKGDKDYTSGLDEIIHKTSTALKLLITDPSITATTESILEKQFLELKDILHGVYLVRECSTRSLDFISGYGEILNCTVITAAMKSRGMDAHMIDARDVIVTDDNHGSARVYLQKSYKKIQEKLSPLNGKIIITGFIATSENGVMTTLGRNGSDYSASIFAAALQTEVCEIWTDVDGVLTADPRIVENARVIPELSVEEAMEMSYFGAEVIHPSTLLPTIDRNIPVVIRNTLNVEAPGTIIKKGAAPSPFPITGIASIDSVALINIQGGGMVGIPGMASRIFSSLARADVNIIMISQASSEHSICIVCRQGEADKAIKQLKSDLAEVIEEKRVENIEATKDLELIAVIGERMKGQVGLSGRLFSALGQANVNILAIAQGSTEKNISFVISGKDRQAALNSVHKSFLGEEA